MNLGILFAIALAMAGMGLSLTIVYFSRGKIGKEDMRLRYENGEGGEHVLVVGGDRRRQIEEFIDELEHRAS